MDIDQPMPFGGDDLGMDFDMGGGDLQPAAARPEDPQSDNDSRSSKKRVRLQFIE